MRKTYHYDKELGKMVEGPAPANVRVPVVSDAFYAAKPFKAHDGTIIDSKAKHRAYMKRHGLTTMDDFTNTWAKQAEERASYYQGTNKQWREETKRDIARAMDQLGRK